TMMDVPLTIGWIFEHVQRNHGAREVAARLDDGSIFHYTYAGFGRRVAQLAHALVELGIRPGDRVASFGWNTHRHLELYYAVPMIGAVLHTTNIRLFPEQVCWAFEHAGDKLIFVDASLTPAVARATATRRDFTRPFVVMGPAPAELPHASDYEALLAGRPERFDWPELDERAAAILCYTSATTGDPKGVLFTHRSSVLHALAAGLADALNIQQRDAVMPIVPMFHVNAWGIPYLAPMIGAKLVMPGAKLDPQSIIDLVEREKVTLSLGVPTVWLAVRDELEKRDAFLPTLKSLVIGGSAVPPSLFDDLERRGIRTVHAWGMTEMSPIGTTSRLIAELEDAPWDELRERLLKQGRFTPIVAWKLLDEAGEEVPRDGKTPGALWVRGPAVTGSYFRISEDLPAFKEGWFHTGDVCTVDEHGYLQLVDRSKDLVKSGGEWISSVDLENLLMGHPSVKEAAVIGLAHPKWVERPVAVVVLREGQHSDESALQAWLGERVVKWMIPDRVLFVEAIPRTGVGKFLKRELRETYKDLLSGA
ncbi:MAG TPA: long-chain fatty acid--CoA ligase, partial [Candidatus Baltobacteraceae bacterium]|nr:long-chain fatty acid--CoA ligase [Candidatus Baltobacteraceae bacterium]